MSFDFQTPTLRVINIEAQTINGLKEKINQYFIHCCEIILKFQEHVIVKGIGKLSHIAAKIAANISATVALTIIDVLGLMKKCAVTSLVIINDVKDILGLLTIHDILCTDIFLEEELLFS